MHYKANDAAIRYTGRWYATEDAAVTSAPGSSMEIAYKGKLAVLYFDISANTHPYPHLWISVDGGADIEVPLERELKVSAKENGNHLINIVFKSAVECQHRWYMPLVGKVDFRGFDADDAGILPEDNRKIIEFIGDSITEGVLVDAFHVDGDDEKSAKEAEGHMYNLEQNNRVYQDDACATYAYLTAQALNLRPVIMGYGAVGLTKSGQGAVPRAELSYPYYFDGKPILNSCADYIVINHGTNDSFNTSSEYIKAMERFLNLVRTRNPDAKIAVIFPFMGCFHDELCTFIPEYNKRFGDDVFGIDTSGWLPKHPIHPLRKGHEEAAVKLTEVLKEWI